MPATQGCLKPITIRIPEGSILCPSPTSAVVGGNVLTSQRVTDVVLKAFNAAAASQVPPPPPLSLHCTCSSWPCHQMRLCCDSEQGALEIVFRLARRVPDEHNNLVRPNSQRHHACMNVDLLLPQGRLSVHPKEAPSCSLSVLGPSAFSAACDRLQGCMNNLTFGDEQLGYYETIAGGAGAGPHWHGRSGVHTHMTNTRITDPEIFERRLPVVLHEFSLRPGSGGDGEHRGGDGVVREVRSSGTSSVIRLPLTGRGGGILCLGMMPWLDVRVHELNILGGWRLRWLDTRRAEFKPQK